MGRDFCRATGVKPIYYRHIQYDIMDTRLLITGLTLLAFLAVPAHSDIISSSNFTSVIVVDAAPGISNSSSSKVIFSLEGIVGNATNPSRTQNLCIGYICVLFGPSGEMFVVFLLDTSVGGASGDQAFVDDAAITPGTSNLFKLNQLSKYYTCVQDSALSGTPVFGVIHAGTKLRYIRVDNPSQYSIRVAQDLPGNRFVVPVTGGGCQGIGSKLPFSYTPFMPIEGITTAVDLIVRYPFDLMGDFERSGKFTLVFENLGDKIAVRPV